MNSLVVRSEIQEKINNNQSILGMKVFGVWGGFVYNEGGEDICPEGHLTGYDPKKFKKWQGSSAKIGVYYE